MKQAHQSLGDSLISDTSAAAHSQQPPDPPPQVRPEPTTIEGQSFFQKTFYIWLHPFLKDGSQNGVEVESMPKLPEELKTEPEYDRLYSTWKSTSRRKTAGLTLGVAALKAFKSQLLVVLMLILGCTVTYVIGPYLTSNNIKYISDPERTTNRGLLLFFTTVVVLIFNKIFFSQLLYRFSVLGVNLNNSFIMMIYCKSLKFSSLANKKFSEAEIINYSQVDAERMTYVGYHLAALIYGPLQVLFGLMQMYFFAGLSFLASVAVMILLCIFTYFTGKITARLNEKVLKAKDERMKVTQEMLDIIRFIKISVIQKFFYNKVDEKRSKEIYLYIKKGILNVITIITFWFTTPLMLSGTFLMYILTGHTINSNMAFSTIMVVGIIEWPIYAMPTAISELIQVMVSLKRIETFLLADEINREQYIEKNKNETEFAIRIEEGNFYWGKEEEKKEDEEGDEDKDDSKKKKKDKKKKKQETIEYQEESNVDILVNEMQHSEEQGQKDKPKFIHVLKDINTTVSQGKFVMIIGDIGSGKSSLLNALLNQMYPSRRSRVEIAGSIAYAAQKPWIMSKSVKENITFTQPFNQRKLDQVVYHASLEHDLKILPKGIETEIGEKGVNISGGQKARISLARALYSDKDIYLLDDILSAVDVHVGEIILKETLKGYLNGKTILMPTHAIKFLESADEIIVMKKGKIARKGHFNDISQTPEFQEIYAKETEKGEDNEEKEEEEDEKEIEAELAMLNQAMQHASGSKDKSRRSEGHHQQPNTQIVEELMLPEDQEKGEVSRQVLHKFIVQGGGYFKFVFLVVLMQLLWLGFKTYSLLVMEKWCETPLGNDYQLYIYIGANLISSIFIFFRAYFLVIACARQSEVIHRSMIKGLLYAGLGQFYNRVPIGRIVNRLTKDLRELDQMIGDYIGWFVSCFSELLGTLFICIYASSPLAVIPMIFVGFICNKLRVYYMKTQREVARFEKSTNSPVVTGFMATIGGLGTIRAYGKERAFIEMEVGCIDHNKRVRVNKVALENWFSLWLTFFSFLVNFPCVAYCMFSHTSNPALVGLIMTYIYYLSDNIIGVTQSTSELETKMVSLERIYKFTNIQPEKDYKEYCEQWEPIEQGNEQGIKQGKIEFRGLNAKYRSDLPDVLKSINCRINPGEKVGIVGRTGAGKTTLINTLLRVTQISRGRITLDDQSITDYPLKQLRHSITMIDQEPTLIKATFRENLDLTGNYTDEQLKSILEECNLLSIVEEKGGLDAMISNESLSAGEKQLLCICRAFLKHSKVVLVDEATANIDVKNDALIQKVIADKFKESTVLTIAHRLTTLQNSDKIMVMEKGELVEFGSPEELQSKENGFYAEMMRRNSKEMLG